MMSIDEKKQLLGKAFWDREIDPDLLYAFVNDVAFHAGAVEIKNRFGRENRMKHLFKINPSHPT